VPNLLKLAQWFCSKRFLNDPTPFLHFCDYLPFEEDLALYLNKLESPSPKYNLYQVWLNFARWFWRRFFKENSVYFYSFAIISPSGRVILFVCTKLNPLHPKIICIVISLIEFGLLVFDKKIFKDFQCIFTLSLLSPLGGGLFPSFEQTWIPFT
jgi:hypothetical protein